MEFTRKDIDTHYGESRSYQEKEFDKIADAIRYVDGTTKEKDPIVALDFWKRIRALKGGGEEWTGDCCFGDNFPNGCGENHGLLCLSYTLVNCVTARVKPLDEVIGDGCLCEDNFAYGDPACGRLHGLSALNYTLINVTIPVKILGGWYIDADN